MEAVLYTRISHLQRSVSVQDQERECRAVCERNDWPVRAVFCDDGISASRYGKERPAWEALKAELREGDVLVVWESSRAQRDLGEFVALRGLCSSLNVPLSYSGRTLDLTKGDDRFIGGIDALVAERESEQIKERVLRGKRTAAAEGRPSSRPPWGYRRKVDPETQTPIPAVWEFDPVESMRVREAVARFLRGSSRRSILHWLQSSEGWSPSDVTGLQRALCNPAIAGLRVHRKAVVGRGTWKPIITEEQHRQVLNRFDSLKRAYGHVSWPGPEPKHLLSGIATCGHQDCGLPLRHKIYRRRKAAYVCPKSHCSCVVDTLDRAVEDELFELASSVNMADYQTDDPAVAQAQAELDEVRAELEGWREDAEHRRVSRESFVRIEKGLLNRIAILRPKTVGRADVVSHIDFDKLQAGWPRLSMRSRREYIRGFLTVTVMSVEPRRGACPCGHPKLYARGLCSRCYERARRGKIPMPPLRYRDDGRFVIERK